MEVLVDILKAKRENFQNCLIVVESLYSMDGDIIDLSALVDIKRKYGCWLLVDEAHSIGVMGATGRVSANMLVSHPKT